MNVYRVEAVNVEGNHFHFHVEAPNIRWARTLAIEELDGSGQVVGIVEVA